MCVGGCAGPECHGVSIKRVLKGARERQSKRRETVINGQRGGKRREHLNYESIGEFKRADR